ncbi:hypothetical protein SAMN05216359_111111 [Roseateles sp. YR242]|uniref:hypothetical protein n=1 Tax=Roseateles sp. YR242 TaxID=1855305 RepID=UPI0008C0D1C1|nr:hypothetical protein [Roseateles sp. YR242]SEL57613.1 hypothetical protein SAMN05216359_111111 [Roseateles sp. YR242]
MKWSSRSTVGLALAGTLVAAYFAPEPQAEGLALSDKAKASAERNRSGAERSVAAPAGRSAEGAAAMRVDAQPVGRENASEGQVQVLALRSRDGKDAADGDSDAGWFGLAAARPRPVVVQAPVSAQEGTAAPEPTAPALPFRPFGRYLDGGEDVVFLLMNDQNLAVRVGDTIAQQYRVERLEGNTLTLRYLPLDVLQTLDLGGGTN